MDGTFVDAKKSDDIASVKLFAATVLKVNPCDLSVIPVAEYGKGLCTYWVGVLSDDEMLEQAEIDRADMAREVAS